MGIAVGRDVPGEITLDICIVGAGASGLTIASDLLAKPLNVGILESGGHESRPDASETGDESTESLHYAALSTSRLKGFGGSTQMLGWGGLCKPLDPQDFMQRPWVADSGWPFDYSHLKPFYDRAGKTLGLGDIDVLGSRQKIFDGRSSLIASDNVELCRHYRLGRHLRAPIEKSTSVNVLTRVTVLYFEFSDDGASIRSAICVDAANNRFRAVAKVFVLAAGGIENARLLLLSNDRAKKPQGLVGKYFMDHPRFTIGTLKPADGKVRRTLAHFDRIRVARRQRITRKLKLEKDHHFRVQGLTLPFETQQSEKLLNYRAWVEPCYVGQYPEALEKLRKDLLEYRDNAIMRGQSSRLGLLLKDLSWTKGMHIMRPLSLVRNFRLHHILEPEPLASSAVSLSARTDRFGMQFVSLSWQISSATFDSLKRTIAIFQGELKRTALGSLDVAAEEWEQLKRPMWTWHHMGTTRMHSDPEKGVVDANCQVHGVNNLFVAGSSVFPTAGNDTPTITIVALAHKLADHLLKIFI